MVKLKILRTNHSLVVIENQAIVFFSDYEMLGKKFQIIQLKILFFFKKIKNLPIKM